MAQEIVSVAASEDDAQEKGNETAFISTTAALTIGRAVDLFHSGLYFDVPNLASGDTITGATLEIVEVFGIVNMDADIHGNDVDTASDFLSEADVTGRVRTTASVQWTATLASGAPSTSPDFAAVVQEIVDRPGYSASMAILLVPRSTLEARFAGWDHTSLAAPEITIDYTAAGGAEGQPTMKRWQNVPHMGGGGVQFGRRVA